MAAAVCRSDCSRALQLQRQLEAVEQLPLQPPPLDEHSLPTSSSTTAAAPTPTTAAPTTARATTTHLARATVPSSTTVAATTRTSKMLPPVQTNLRPIEGSSIDEPVAHSVADAVPVPVMESLPGAVTRTSTQEPRVMHAVPVPVVSSVQTLSPIDAPTATEPVAHSVADAVPVPVMRSLPVDFTKITKQEQDPMVAHAVPVPVVSSEPAATSPTARTTVTTTVAVTTTTAPTEQAHEVLSIVNTAEEEEVGFRVRNPGEMKRR